MEHSRWSTSQWRSRPTPYLEHSYINHRSNNHVHGSRVVSNSNNQRPSSLSKKTFSSWSSKHHRHHQSSRRRTPSPKSLRKDMSTRTSSSSSSWFSKHRRSSSSRSTHNVSKQPVSSPTQDRNRPTTSVTATDTALSNSNDEGDGQRPLPSEDAGAEKTDSGAEGSPDDSDSIGQEEVILEADVVESREHESGESSHSVTEAQEDLANKEGKQAAVAAPPPQPLLTTIIITQSGKGREVKKVENTGPSATVNIPEQKADKCGTPKKGKPESPAEEGRLLGSVMKTDLGEILRRSCRERKMNTRFTDDSVTPISFIGDGSDRKGRNSSARVKEKQPVLATSKATGGRVAATAGAKVAAGGKDQNAETAQKTLADKQFPDENMAVVAIDGGKRLTIKKQIRARKSFGSDTTDEDNNKPTDTSSPPAPIPGKESSPNVVPNTLKKFPNPFRACMLKRNKKRFFKGTTYSLSPRHKKRKKAAALQMAKGDEESANSDVTGRDSQDTSEQDLVIDDKMISGEEEEEEELPVVTPPPPVRLLEREAETNDPTTGTDNPTSHGGASKIDNSKDRASVDNEDSYHRLLGALLDAKTTDKYPSHVFKRKQIGQEGTAPKFKRKNNSAEKAWVTPLGVLASLIRDDKKMASITFPQPIQMLCTCRTLDGTHVTTDIRGGFCQGIDCIDSKLIGCVNTASVTELLRPATRVPFQALCEVHRQRLRLHQCCPGCGLFCTQGQFIQCRADPRKAIHHSHKDCLLTKNGKEMCPHCGEGSHIQEINLELNAPRLPTLYSKQQQPPLRKEPGARMAFTKGTELPKPSERSSDASSQSFVVVKGKRITSSGLPMGPERSQLEELLTNLSNQRPTNVRYHIKNMLSASKSGDVEKVLQMLMLGFDAGMRFEEQDNCTPLHVAAANGHLAVVHVLVQAKACIDPMDNAFQTPLMFAIESGNVHVSLYLIKNGARLDTRGDDGMSVLHLAAKAGQMEVCRVLLETRKVNVNVQDDGGWTALVWAAEHRHLPVVKFLLEHGSDPNIRDNEQNIALHWSCFAGSLEISELFLNHGCDLNISNEHGDSPLHIAARQDKYECVMLLLARNANVDCQNKEGETPLLCCPDPNSQTWLALSMSKHLKKITVTRSGQSEKILHQDISRGKEQNAIQCINGADDESTPPFDFIYVKENCETSSINMDRSIASLQTCICNDDDDCSSSKCTCGTMSLKCWYDKDGKLVDHFNLLDPPMIFECNRACKCWTTCRNRVVQHGIACRLQLFRTKGKGWGVRSLRDIPKGTFICEYVGEVISDLEADQREDDAYLFDLDNRDGETYCIDARRYGNVSRFINHLCEPNLVPVKVFVDYQDLRFPRIALFSSRSIRAYEELGFDYGEKFWIIKHKMFTCECMSDRCKYSSETIGETLASYNTRMELEEDVTEVASD